MKKPLREPPRSSSISEKGEDTENEESTDSLTLSDPHVNVDTPPSPNPTNNPSDPVVEPSKKKLPARLPPSLTNIPQLLTGSQASVATGSPAPSATPNNTPATAPPIPQKPPSPNKNVPPPNSKNTAANTLENSANNEHQPTGDLAAPPITMGVKMVQYDPTKVMLKKVKPANKQLPLKNPPNPTGGEGDLAAPPITKTVKRKIPSKDAPKKVPGVVAPTPGGGNNESN